MSTRPETGLPAADRLINVLSRWLAGHVRTEDLGRCIDEIGLDGLEREQVEAVAELLAELRDPAGHPGELQKVVRETVEALALG